MVENSQISVLVVDDEPSVRVSLTSFLEDYEFHVSDASSGEDAMKHLSPDAADVAIVDYRLPGMSGDVFIEQAHERYPDMRFLVYTGSVHYRIPENISKIGLRPEHVFIKPVSNMIVFKDSIRSLMQGK